MYILSGIIKTEDGERNCTIYFADTKDKILMAIKRQRTKERKAQYYIENQERFKAYAKARYKKKRKIKMKKRFTVHFEKTEGGYRWVAYVRSDLTNRLVKFESAGYFQKLRDAKEDYIKATE